MVSRHEVLARLDAGDPAGAARVAGEILAARPQNADVQGLLGLALDEVGHREAAIDAMRLAVALSAVPSIALRNTTNLAAMLVGAGLKDEAVALLRSAWPWLPDIEIGDNERQCITLLADIMKGLGLNEELVAFLLPILERAPHQWGVVRRTAVALSTAGRHEDALRLIETTARPPSEEPDRQALLAYLYGQTRQPEKAEAAAVAFACHNPPYATPRRAEQWFTVGVLNPMPVGARLLAGDHSRHFNSNFPAQLVGKLASRYRFASILLGAGPAAVAQFREHRPRVMLNNVVNAEVLLDGRALATAQALTESIGLPVINPPRHAAMCTRQMNFERLAGTPDMVVPRLKRFNVLHDRIDEMVRLAEQSFDYPLLVRTVRDHDAHNLVRVLDRTSLREAFTNMKEPQVYLIQDVGATRLKGCHRRLRASFVEGVPVLMRADYLRHWIVKGRKWPAQQHLYRSHPDILADANDIVARPDVRLGSTAMAALDAIGRAIPLDIFCLDFDVDESGRVVFFEANPCANMFSNAPAEIDYPASADARLQELIERLLHARVEAGATTAKATAPG